jgi:DNA-binding MarR family transcriptional regulator
MLSDRLRVLEAEGLVERRVVPETPVRVEYQLTQKGRSLDQALAAIGEWAELWIEAPATTPAVNVTPAAEPLDGYPSQPVDPRPFAGKPRIKPKVSP